MNKLKLRQWQKVLPRLGILFLIMCYNYFAYGQNKLDFYTRVPTDQSEFLHLGLNQYEFKTSVSNIDTLPLTVNTVTLAMPVGMELIMESISVSSDNVPIEYTRSSNVLTFTKMLQPSQSFDIVYIAYPTCASVPIVSDNFSINLTNNIAVEFLFQGQLEIEEGVSSSYPVKFPGLQVLTPASPANSRAVIMKESFTETIPIQNARGAGMAIDMIFNIELQDVAALSLTTLTLQGAMATVELPFTVNGNIISAAIPSNVLAQVDADGLLGEEETITLTAEYMVEKYFANTQVKYTIDYLAWGETCRRYDNATGLMYYTQTYPEPVATINRIEQTNGNWCGTDFVAEYTITNNAATNNPSHYMMNTYIGQSGSSVQLISVTCDSVPITPVGGRYYIPTGTDFDGDGNANDLAPGESFSIVVVARINQGSNMYSNSSLIISCRYNTLDNRTLYNSISNFARFSNTNTYVTGPSDLEEDESGVYAFHYSTDFYNLASMLMNVSLSAICDATGQEVSIPITQSAMSGSVSFSVTATCAMPLSFRLIVRADDCEPRTLSTATANTVVRCQSEGGSCYGIYTTRDSVFINPQVVNTCEHFNIEAKGTFDHWYRDTCPEFSDIVVKLYDKGGIVPLEYDDESRISLNINGTTVQGERYNIEDWSNNTRLAFRFPASGLLNHIDTIINHERFELDARLKVRGTHSLPDVSAGNIRVEFAAIDENGVLNQGGWDWGASLTVYDPEPSFESYGYMYPCTINGFRATIKPQKPGGTFTGIKVHEITFPSTPQFFYNDLGIEHIGDTYTQSIEQNFSPGISSRNIRVANSSAVCVEDGSTVLLSGASITYTDFYGTTCAESKTITFPNRSELTYMPKFLFHPTETQQSIGATTTWNIALENNGSVQAPNSMLRLEVDRENSMMIIIREVKLDGQILFLNNYNGAYYVDLGSINFNTQKQISVLVTYINCTNQGISKINLQAVWACDSLTPQNFSIYQCNGVATTLLLENMNAVLDATELYPQVYHQLCEPVPIHIDIDNTGRADLTNLGFWFSSVGEGISLVDNAIYYNNRSETLENEIRGVNLFSQNSLISTHIISDFSTPDPSAPFSGTSPTIGVDFDIALSCGLIEDIVFNTRALSNCGDEQLKTFTFRPRIAGFEQLDSLIVSAEISAMHQYQGTAVADVSIYNSSSVLVDSAYISVFLPTGIEYVSFTPYTGTDIIGSPVFTNNSDSTTLIEWKLNQTNHIRPGETVGLFLTVRDVAQCPPSTSYIDVAGRLERTLRGCDGAMCNTSQRTKFLKLRLDRPSFPFTANITGASSSCVGRSETYSISGSDICNVQWSISPAIGVITANGNTASVQYTGEGIATVTASACPCTCPGSCRSLTVTTSVGAAPTPVINFTEVCNTDWSADSTSILAFYEFTNFTEYVFVPDTADCAGSIAGEYTFTKVRTTSCGTAEDKLTVLVNCCCVCEEPQTWGDLAITQRAGVTTYDVQILRYYVEELGANPENLIYVDDCGYYAMDFMYCDVATYTTLTQCFPEYADINKDGVVDMNDVVELQKLVE